LNITSSASPPVAVLGANGHTGRFVVDELVRRGLAPIAIGRDRGRLAECGFEHRGITTRVASMDSAESLAAALQDASAVINCAGPFMDTAEAVARAAIEARIHYLDISAEQPSTQAVYDHFGGMAIDAGVVLLPAMSFYGGFADLLASAALTDGENADDIRICIGIALDHWHPTSGTRRTGAKNTAPRVVVSGGRFVPAPAPLESDWVFPPPFGQQTVVELPFSEIPVISRHIPSVELHTFLSLNALMDIRDPNTPPPTPVDERGRSGQTFLVEARVCSGGRTHRAVARGQDIYATTASLVCEAAQRLIEGRFQSPCTHAPGAVFDAREFLESLAPASLQFELALDRGSPSPSPDHKETMQ
jgi:short subunit dehydrogenase-like uncharacterized protein